MNNELCYELRTTNYQLNTSDLRRICLYNCSERFTNQTFFAKRTLIPKKSNERNLFNNSRL